MTVAMAANSLGARDAAGFLGAFAAATPLNRARPAAVTITDTNGGLDGRAEPGDSVAITFSEPLAPASVAASTTVILTDPVGTGNDTLTMGGVSNGAHVMGSNSYVTVDTTIAVVRQLHRRPEQRRPHHHRHHCGVMHRHRLCRSRTAGHEHDLFIRRRNHAHRRGGQRCRHHGQDPEHPPLLTFTPLERHGDRLRTSQRGRFRFRTA